MAEKLTEYDQAARVIALYLDEFCDDTLDYVNMIAEASMLAQKEISNLRNYLKLVEENYRNAVVRAFNQPYIKEEKINGVQHTQPKILCDDCPDGVNCSGCRKYSQYCPKCTSGGA